MLGPCDRLRRLRPACFVLCLCLGRERLFDAWLLTRLFIRLFYSSYLLVELFLFIGCLRVLGVASNAPVGLLEAPVELFDINCGFLFIVLFSQRLFRPGRL